MSKSRFSKQSVINAPVEAVFKWHSRPGAIERLSPPWDPLKVLCLSGGIEIGAKVTLAMKAGPFPYKWFARHTDYRENEFFRDEQIKGPFSEWIHTHRFEPDGKNRCVLEDIIEYKLPFHYASKFLTQKLINKKLELTLEQFRSIGYRIFRCDRSVSFNLNGQALIIRNFAYP